ncbi:hypothetical protein Leryth_000535 [Lithospermum erythrorhizon]|nr:hypothetical protein Leryth_000535 [Lithospermum erythrorhizon]
MDCLAPKATDEINSTILTQLSPKATYVLLEIDRILRPNGYAIIREASYYVDGITTLAKGMRRSCRKQDRIWTREGEGLDLPKEIMKFDMDGSIQELFTQ